MMKDLPYDEYVREVEDDPRTLVRASSARATMRPSSGSTIRTT